MCPNSKYRNQTKNTTHFKSETSLPKKLMMLDVNMKLEKTVNSPAMTTAMRREEASREINIEKIDQIVTR